MFKNKTVNILSSINLLISLIGFIIMVSGLPKIGSGVLFFAFVTNLITGLSIYYGLGKNGFMGKSKTKTNKEVLENQKNGFKLTIPLIIIFIINIILITIYFVAFN